MVEGLTLLIVLAAGAWLVRTYRRGVARTRGELERARGRHLQALQQLAAQQPGLSLQAAGPAAFAALVGATPDLDLRLGVGAALGRTTFIRYATQLALRPRCGRFRPQPGGERVLLEVAQLGPAQAALEGLGMTAGELRSLLLLTSRVEIAPGQILLEVRPASGAQRYSYGLHLQLDPEALSRLLQVGCALGQRLLEPAPPAPGPAR